MNNMSFKDIVNEVQKETLKYDLQDEHCENCAIRNLNKMPYIENSVTEINQDGARLIQPVIDYLKSHRGYRYGNRINAFKKAKIRKDGTINMNGIIAGYRLRFNYQNHTVKLYILLKNVTTDDKNDNLMFLADHLWVRPDIEKQHMEHNFATGIGDMALVSGYPDCYYGRITPNRNGYKMGIGNAFIALSRYPEFKNGCYQYGEIPYQHGLHCLYRLDKYTHKLILGKEISTKDRKKIQQGNFKLSTPLNESVNHIVQNGKNKTKQKLILDVNNYHLKWCKLNITNLNYRLMTTSENVKNNVKIAENNVWKKLVDNNDLKPLMDTKFPYITNFLIKNIRNSSPNLSLFENIAMIGQNSFF